MQSANKISFKSIGEFNLNSEKNIVFTPYEQVNYLASSFGLTNLIAPSIKREVIEHLFEDAKEEEEPDKPASDQESKGSDSDDK